MYIAESPLYEITCKDKTWFAYTDAEKSEIVKKLEGKKLSINRSKGLGENDPEFGRRCFVNWCGSKISGSNAQISFS